MIEGDVDVATVSRGPACEVGCASPVAVEAIGLTQVYRRGQQRVVALDDVSLCIPQGGATALVGPSGAGKSTLLHLLAGLSRPVAGDLRVAGRDLRQLSAPALARFRNREVGVIFQAFNLLPDLTAWENIFLPLHFGDVRQRDGEARVHRLLDVVGLSPAADRRPAQLSGGEQQRVAIARALVTDPALILADEPTGNLDADTGWEIASLLFTLAREFAKTLILVTHHPQLAEQADRRIAMAAGRLVAGESDACS